MCASFGCGPKPTYNFCEEVVRICGIYTITIVPSVQRAAPSSSQEEDHHKKNFLDAS
jgi:hypothetical protein